MAALAQAFQTPRLSAWVYFIYVTLVTAAGLGVAILFRPPLAHSLASFLGLERQPRAAPDSFYAVRIAPLFQEHCAGCHGARRQRANLRLDSFAAAMRGGNHGPVIMAADVKGSELLTRLMLPPNNEKSMPPSGRPPLSTDDVKVIRLWIAAGASGQLPVAAIPGTPPLRLKVEFPTIDADAVARARAPLV